MIALLKKFWWIAAVAIGWYAIRQYKAANPPGLERDSTDIARRIIK